MEIRRTILSIFLVAFFLTGFQTLSDAQKVPGVTDDTILIGATAPLTGPLTATGAGAHDGWQMYFDMVNDAGGIHGRKIKVLWEDTGCVPAKAMAAVKKLIKRDKVFALAGGVCSNAMLATIPVMEKEDIPYFTANCSGPPITHPLKKSIFRAGQLPTNLQARSLGKLAIDVFKADKIGILHLSDEFGAYQRTHAKKYLEEKNTPPVAVESFTPGDVDYTAQLTRLKEAGAKVVLFIAWLSDGAKIVTQAKRMGFYPQWIGAGPTSEAPFQVLAGEAAVGTVHMWPGKYLVSDTHIPMIAKFREEFRKRIGEKPGRPSTAELVNYAGAMVFVEGLKRAGKALTRAKLVEALESIKNFDTPLAGLVNFSKNDHHGNYKVTFVVNLPNMHRALLDVNIVPK